MWNSGREAKEWERKRKKRTEKTWQYSLFLFGALGKIVTRGFYYTQLKGPITVGKVLLCTVKC